MSTKTVMTIVAGALVAGFVLGNFGIAGAGSKAATPAPQAAAQAADCTDCAPKQAADCADCDKQATESAGCPGGMNGASTGGCPSGSSGAECGSTCP